MKSSWSKFTVITVVVTVITGSLAALALAAKVGDAASVPSRVRALEDWQKQTGERLSALAFDLRAMATESQNSARRAEESGQAIKTTLIELTSSVRTLSAAVAEQNARIIKIEASTSRQ